jgi:hypothetical protein
VFEELVEEKWIANGKTKETMSNFFDLQTRQAKDYVDTVAARIKRDLVPPDSCDDPRGPASRGTALRFTS